MTDNVIPFPVPANQEKPDRWAEKKRKTKKVDVQIGPAYGYCPLPAESEHVPWTDVVLGQGRGDWTR